MALETGSTRTASATTHSHPTGDFRDRCKSPALCGLRDAESSLDGAAGGRSRFPNPESLAWKIFFLGNRDAGCRDWFEGAR